MTGLRIMAALGLVLVGGCAGLPPKTSPVSLRATVPVVEADATAGQWPGGQWWQRYEDPTLNRLIDAALQAAPSLRTAHARFDAARESVRLAGASTGAHVSFSGDLERQRLSDNGLFPPRLLGFHWYDQADLGLQGSYTFDWWGKQRATIAAALDQAQASAAERSAAATLLTASIADAYFGWQADQARLELAVQRQAAARHGERIARARFGAELDAADAVQRAAVEVATADEQHAVLQESAQLRRIELAALVGCAPAELPELVARPLPDVSAALPENIRVDLIARRPDITASRWRVESAERGAVAARAEFFPDISINALAGVSAVELGKLIQYPSRVPSAGLAIHLPLFDGGTLAARYRGAEANIRSAVAAYDQTLLDAAREVSTQVILRRQLAEQRQQRLLEVGAARQLRDSAAAQLRQGLADARSELNATLYWIAQRDALLQIDGAAVSADIGLQRALGGGYDAGQTLTDSSSRPSEAKP